MKKNKRKKDVKKERMKHGNIEERKEERREHRGKRKKEKGRVSKCEHSLGLERKVLIGMGQT